MSNRHHGDELADHVPPNRPYVGELVNYISPYTGDIYEALIRNIRPNGSVDIEVYFKGLKSQDAELHTLRIRSLSYGKAGRVRPRE